jgi:3-hydroxybutyryl-CoA dehydratase
VNRFKFSELKVGQSEGFSVTLSEAQLRQFVELSGDANPLHVSDEAARSRGFRQKVVHGLLSSSLYSRLVGMVLPGENCLLQGIEVTFSGPAYPGDELTVRGEVVFLNEAYRVAEIKAQITNAAGGKISRAKIKVGVHE